MGKWEKTLLYLMAAFYVIAGIYHFVNPIFYKKIMPLWLPWHYSLIFISGVCEIVLGLMLLSQWTRKLAAWGLIALLIAVFPTNVQMMVNHREQQNPDLWVAILRLPIQLLLIGWAYRYTKSKKN